MTLVDGASRQVLYDELVKPRNAITDYNTRFSGISEADMRNVKTTLEDAQQAFLQHVPA